ncbi:AAA family ATPase [Methylobacterium sp.]|uniref:AAA family ATPase n=1 Tax=Methylobacterium sp. TaxID=409 RepID=UPI000FBCEF08|nr:AAA family ATPase [Methylobacterium sp.]RUP22324.1 MAG: hypothetical protein EKK44_05460 [Methylobacterium sp.]
MNAHHVPQVQPAVSSAFLRARDPDGFHFLVSFSPETGKPVSGFLVHPGDWAGVEAWVLANAHLNLYWTVNEVRADIPPGTIKPRKEHIAWIRAVVADIDPAGGTAAEVREQRAELYALVEELADGEAPPSIAWDTGNGVQFLWDLIEKLDAAIERITVEELGRGIAHELDGDAVFNVDRILRLPGSINHSTPDKRKRNLIGGPVSILVQSQEPPRYTIEDLEQVYDALPSPEAGDQDEKVQTALAELEWGVAEAGASEALRARILEIGQRDAYFASLLRGDCKAPGDGSGSDWRAALVRQFKTHGLSITDYAAVALRWPQGQPREGLISPRVIARDWGRVGGQVEAARERTSSLFGAIEVEPDTSHFPAPVAETYELGEPTPPAAEIEWIDPADWHGFEPKEKVWYVPGLVPHNEVTMLTGKGGIGKSLLALQKLVCIALGLPFFGRPTKRAKVVGFFCEDDPDVLHRRTKDICRSLGVDVRDLSGCMRLASRKYADNLLAAYEGAKGSPVMKRTAVFDKLEAFCLEFGAEVALLDTIADVFGGNEIDRQQVRQFVQGCAGRLAGTLGACIIVGHPSKSGQAEGGDGTSGSTAWHGSVRSRLYLEETGEKGSGYVKLTLMKSNYGPSGESWIMRYREGVLDVVSASEPAQGVPETSSLIHSAVLSAIAKARAADVRLVMAANSPHNAANVLRRREPDALKPYSKPQLVEALQQLVALGVIAEEQVGYDKTRNPVKSLVVRGLPDDLSDTTIPYAPDEGGLFD